MSDTAVIEVKKIGNGYIIKYYSIRTVYIGFANYKTYHKTIDEVMQKIRLEIDRLT